MSLPTQPFCDSMTVPFYFDPQPRVIREIPRQRGREGTWGAGRRPAAPWAPGEQDITAPSGGGLRGGAGQGGTARGSGSCLRTTAPHRARGVRALPAESERAKFRRASRQAVLGTAYLTLRDRQLWEKSLRRSRLQLQLFLFRNRALRHTAPRAARNAALRARLRFPSPLGAAQARAHRPPAPRLCRTMRERAPHPGRRPAPTCRPAEHRPPALPPPSHTCRPASPLARRATPRSRPSRLARHYWLEALPPRYHWSVRTDNGRSARSETDARPLRVVHDGSCRRERPLRASGQRQGLRAPRGSWHEFGKKGTEADALLRAWRLPPCPRSQRP